MLSVRLEGKQGNPTAIGARVTITLDDGRTQTVELNAGGGYLSQSSSALYFGRRESNKVREIKVRWPDGSASAISDIGDRSSLRLRQPER